MITIRDLIA